MINEICLTEPLMLRHHNEYGELAGCKVSIGHFRVENVSRALACSMQKMNW